MSLPQFECNNPLTANELNQIVAAILSLQLLSHGLSLGGLDNRQLSVVNGNSSVNLNNILPSGINNHSWDEFIHFTLNNGRNEIDINNNPNNGNNPGVCDLAIKGDIKLSKDSYIKFSREGVDYLTGEGFNYEATLDIDGGDLILEIKKGNNRISSFNITKDNGTKLNLGVVLEELSKSDYLPGTKLYLYYDGSQFDFDEGPSSSPDTGTELGTLLTKLNSTSLPNGDNITKYLYYNGSSFDWSDGTGTGGNTPGATSLSGLSDVNAPAPGDGDILVYRTDSNTNTSKWVNESLPTGNLPSGGGEGDYLTISGGTANWTNATSNITGIGIDTDTSMAKLKVGSSYLTGDSGIKIPYYDSLDRIVTLGSIEATGSIGCHFLNIEDITNNHTGMFHIVPNKAKISSSGLFGSTGEIYRYSEIGLANLDYSAYLNFLVRRVSGVDSNTNNLTYVTYPGFYIGNSSIGQSDYITVRGSGNNKQLYLNENPIGSGGSGLTGIKYQGYSDGNASIVSSSSGYVTLKAETSNVSFDNSTTGVLKISVTGGTNSGISAASTNAIGGIKVGSTGTSISSYESDPTLNHHYYKVKLDSNNLAYVDVPWVGGGSVTSVGIGDGLEDASGNNTPITGTGTIKLQSLHTSNTSTVGATDNANTAGSTFKVPKITYDKFGRITNATEYTMTFPSSSTGGWTPTGGTSNDKVSGTDLERKLVAGLLGAWDVTILLKDGNYYISKKLTPSINLFKQLPIEGIVFLYIKGNILKTGDSSIFIRNPIICSYIENNVRKYDYVYKGVSGDTPCLLYFDDRTNTNTFGIHKEENYDFRTELNTAFPSITYGNEVLVSRGYEYPGDINAFLYNRELIEYYIEVPT